MNPLTYIKLKVMEYTRKAWFKLWDRIDNRFKRMCVLASLHAVLMDCNEPGCNTVNNLNESLDLVKDAEAMRFPMLFAPLIWKGVLPISHYEASSDKLVTRLMRKTPCWLKYTDDESFTNEIKQLLNYCNGVPKPILH